MNALLTNQTESSLQQGVQQPNHIHPPPFEAHPNYWHPTPYIPAPYDQGKAPRLLSPQVQAEEEHPDNDHFDQPELSQLDHNVTTTSKNLRMDGSSSSSESGGWRREGGGERVDGVQVGEGRKFVRICV